MKGLFYDAINSEPFFKYPIFVLKWISIIGFYMIWFILLFVWNLFIEILKSPNTTVADENQSKWIMDCALQEQWQKDHS